MATKNDVTGDEIKSKISSSDLYSKGWDLIFKKKELPEKKYKVGDMVIRKHDRDKTPKKILEVNPESNRCYCLGETCGDYYLESELDPA